MRALRLREGYCVGLCDSAGVSGAGTALPSASLPLVGSGPCTLLALGAERAELSWRITVNNPPPWGRSKNWRPLRVLHQGLGIRTMVLSFVQSLSCVRYLVTPWTAARQAPLSMAFPRQEYWSRLPLPSPGDLSNPGIKPSSLVSPALAGRLQTSILTALYGKLLT